MGYSKLSKKELVELIRLKQNELNSILRYAQTINFEWKYSHCLNTNTHEIKDIYEIIPY